MAKEIALNTFFLEEITLKTWISKGRNERSVGYIIVF